MWVLGLAEYKDKGQWHKAGSVITYKCKDGEWHKEEAPFCYYTAEYDDPVVTGDETYYEDTNPFVVVLLGYYSIEFEEWSDIKPIHQGKLGALRGMPKDVSKEVYDALNCRCYSYLSWDQLKRFDWEQTFTRDGITKTYREAAGGFYKHTIPALEQLAKMYNSNPWNVRLVYGFV